MKRYTSPLISDRITQVYVDDDIQKSKDPLCSCCDNLAISPKKSQCGELLCLQCHSAHSTCPCCKEPDCLFCPITDYMKNCFRKIFCTCPFEEEGCTEVMAITDVALHLKFCAHAIGLCPDCGVPTQNADLPFHLQLDCQKRPVQCPDCPEEVLVCDYAAHDVDKHPTCEGCRVRFHIPTEGKHHQLVQCQLCSQKVLACQMQAHVSQAGHAARMLGDTSGCRGSVSSLSVSTERLSAEWGDMSRKEIYKHMCEIWRGYLRFSPEHHHPDVVLLEDGRAATHNGRWEPAVLDLPKPLSSGVHRWRFKVTGSRCSFGAAMPGTLCRWPGHRDMPGIGLDSSGFLDTQGSSNRVDMQYETGDVITVTLNFPTHTITWTKNGDRSITADLPFEGEYVPAVAVSRNSVARIESYERLDDDQDVDLEQ